MTFIRIVKPAAEFLPLDFLSVLPRNDSVVIIIKILEFASIIFGVVKIYLFFIYLFIFSAHTMAQVDFIVKCSKALSASHPQIIQRKHNGWLQKKLISVKHT